jgi:hypothetical protein
MDDTPHHRKPAGWEPPMPSEAELLASLARSETELAAGQIVSGDEVLRELDESIAPHGGEACGPDASRDRHPSLIALTPEARRHVRAL